MFPIKIYSRPVYLKFFIPRARTTCIFGWNPAIFRARGVKISDIRRFVAFENRSFLPLDRLWRKKKKKKESRGSNWTFTAVLRWLDLVLI